MATVYRKALQNKIIDGFELLEFPDGEGTIFTGVTKWVQDFPSLLPYCTIMPTTPNVEVAGLSSNSRVLGFTAQIYEEIEASTDLSDGEDRIDRLADIEDMAIAYLEQIPNPVEREVTGVHAYKIEVLPSSYQYIDGESGTRVILQLDFNIYCNVNV